MHSMALVHETLYGSENLARIDFAEYAHTLTKDILASYDDPKVSVGLRSELEPTVMSIDLAVPCGLILNELISNAFKHAFPNGTGGQIELSLHKEKNGECVLCVKDDGIGIPDGFDIQCDSLTGPEADSRFDWPNSWLVCTDQSPDRHFGAIAV
jgi:two-component sensor histidine kinase